MAGESRGSISFFATYRPPVALDVYSLPYPIRSSSDQNEVLMTDGRAYNYNGKPIPETAYKKLAPRLGVNADDIVSGGLVFVSERTEGLETIHIAIRLKDKTVKVFNFADLYGTFNGPRLEDHACFSGDYLIYVSTMEDPNQFHQPWNAVYRTHLHTGATQRLTPKGQIDFSPSVSPDGRKVAVASLEGKEGGWCGEIEDLETNIVVFDVDNPLSSRKLVVKDGGWPTWGSNDVLFFHRNIEKVQIMKRWGVFRVNIHDSNPPKRVTPENISAITPAAIDATKVAVATIRATSKFGDERNQTQYRHIEVFEVSDDNIPKEAIEKITPTVRSLADHFNPFVMAGVDGSKRIGYHRCKVTDNVDEYAVVETQFIKIKSPDEKIGVFRVSGVFPTFSPDGKKLAFVDNEFRSVWVADDKGLRTVYDADSNGLFSPAWNQNPEKDILYVCKGPTFSKDKVVQIIAIPLAVNGNQRVKTLTKKFNNAFPSTNPEGTKLVYRSTREGDKNLYIMEDAEKGEYGGGKITRLTEGKWTDTHCNWSPKGDWIVFSSNRDANPNAVSRKDVPDPGYFGVYLVKANNPHTVVKVIDSGYDLNRGPELFPGHVNHPFFSPDGKSIVVASDLAAVSCEPISLPLFSHSVRPYGDIFIVDLEDMDEIKKNENLKTFKRLTHSRYENSTAVWTKYSTDNPHANWNKYFKQIDGACPYVDPSRGESFLVTGHLCIERRCC